MGAVTTVLILNDAIGAIRDDPQFAEKLAEAVRGGACVGDMPGRPEVSIDARPVGHHVFSGAAKVVSCSAQNFATLLLVGGNTAIVLGSVYAGAGPSNDRSIHTTDGRNRVLAACLQHHNLRLVEMSAIDKIGTVLDLDRDRRIQELEAALVEAHAGSTGSE